MWRFALSAHAHVPVIYVTSADEDWCAVINGTQGSDVVMLMPGEYRGPCDIVAKQSNMIGEQTSVQSFDPELPAEFTGSDIDYVLKLSGESVALLQLVFRDLPETVDAVRFGDVREAAIRYSWFRDLPGVAITLEGTPESVLIESNELARVGTAVSLGCLVGTCSAPDVEIVNNLVLDSTLALSMGPFVWGTLRDNVISGAETGVRLWGTEGGELVLEGGLYDTHGASIALQQGPVTVATNIALGQPVLQIDDAFVGRATVTANTLVGALSIGSGGEVTLRDNALVDGVSPLQIPSEGSVVCDASCFVDLVGWDFYPAEGSALRGSAVPDDALGPDWCGRVRNDTPGSGAIEAYDDVPSFGPLSVGYKSGIDCTLPQATADPPTTPPDPPPPPPKEEAPPIEDPSTPAGCGCSTADGRDAALVWLGWVLWVRRRGDGAQRRRFGALLRDP